MLVNMKIDIKYSFILFLAVFLPLSGNNSPIKYPYQLIFFITGLIGFIYVLKLGLKEKGRLRDISILIAIIVFSNCLSGLFNFSTYSIEGSIDLLGFIIAVPVSLVVALSLKTEKRKKNLYTIFMTLVVVNLILGILQLVLGQDIIFGNPAIGGRISGLFSWGAPVVGSYAGLVFPIIVYFFLDDKRKLTFALLFFAIVILLGGNRSMLIVDFITLFFLLLFSKQHRKYAINFILFFSLILAITLPILIIYMQEYLSSNVMYRLTSLGGQLLEEQKTKRLATWAQTLCLVADNPILGVGFGNFKSVMVEYLYCAPVSEGQMPHPHHVYLDIMSSSGLAGSLSVIFFTLYILIQTKLNIKNQNIRIENYLIILIIFSPLNVTHGFASTWWSVMCFIMIGVTIANIHLFGKNSHPVTLNK